MTRNGTTPKTRDLARRLLALEAAGASPSGADLSPVLRVCEKLRRPLSTLAGTAGFRSLLARALALAKHEDRALDSVQVKEDGTLEGLDGEAAQAGTVLIAQLVGLLATFVGETLTLRLLRDAWPDLPGLELNSGGKEST